MNYETIIKEKELADERGIMAHAFERHMTPVSLNCFYAYLQAIELHLILCVASSTGATHLSAGDCAYGIRLH